MVMQLKLTYSRHKDLNVRMNNERSWDYTGGTGAGGGSTSSTHVHRGPPPPAASYTGPGADLLLGGGGGGIAPHEPGPTGALSYHRGLP